MFSFDDGMSGIAPVTAPHERSRVGLKLQRLLEDFYTMEYALVFGAALLTLINRCNRVKAAHERGATGPSPH